MTQLCTTYQMNPQNFCKSCLKTCEWYHMLNYSRKIETFWNSLFDDKSISYRCIQDAEISFASELTYLAIQLPIWMPESSLIMSISGNFNPWRQGCLYLLHLHPKIALELWQFIHPEYSWAKLYRFCHAFIFMPIWRSIFSFQFFEIGK